MSGEKVDLSVTTLGPSYLISEELFAEFEAKGHETRLVTLTHDLHQDIIKVGISCGECQCFFDSDASIEECVDYRPSPKLKKAGRTKGKK